MTAATDTREHLARALAADLVLAPELGREEDTPTEDDELGARWAHLRHVSGLTNVHPGSIV